MKTLISIVLVLTLAGLSACAPPRPLPRERAQNVAPAGSPFNHVTAQQHLTQARTAEYNGDAATAREGYRQAALAWPGLTSAWRGLARTARSAGEDQEHDAARFIAARTALTEPDDILTQRELAPALRTYLAEQEQSPEANPLTIEYGTQLAGFYEDLYELRGTYEQPKPFGNIQPNEVPTAIITGLATSIYIGTVLTGTD